MTKEEFRDYVDSLRSQNEISYDVYSGLIDGIDTLEQEPCEDAISRQAVIDEAFEVDTKEYGRIEVVGVDAIEALPPVNPQPKIGHWIEHPEIETSVPEYLMFYECSECGGKLCFCKPDIHKKRFCNYCGCRMVEPQESEIKDEDTN